ncbi:flagellar hook-length control protein FliK [Pseudoalteromonas sp. T1lg65]|uniref:flagellar hook-length control protein FliK n=1 Tax=Pseudoalteromonas sp. T1lg65 TaxID=2077101 RepID=UPI003F796C50
MNKPSITLNTSSVSISDHSKSNASQSLFADKTFIAQNIVINQDKLKMDIAIDGRWQTVHIALKHNTGQSLNFNQAQIVVDETGKHLTITSDKQQADVVLAKQLLDILASAKSLPKSTQLASSVLLQLNNSILLKELGVQVAIPKAVTQLLATESTLVATLGIEKGQFRIKVFNQFSDLLFDTQLKKTAISELISQQIPTAKLKTDTNSLFLQIKDQQLELSGVKHNWGRQLSWQDAKVSASINGINLFKPSVQTMLETTKPVVKMFEQAAHSVSTYTASPTQPLQLSSTLTYSKPLIELSFNDIKSSIMKVLQSLTARPFAQITPSLSPATTPPAHSKVSNISASMVVPKPLSPAAHSTEQPIKALFDSVKNIVPFHHTKKKQNDSSNAFKLTAETKLSAIKQYINRPSFETPPTDFADKQASLQKLLNHLSDQGSRLSLSALTEVIKKLQQPLYIQGNRANIIDQLNSFSQSIDVKQLGPIKSDLTTNSKGPIEALLTTLTSTPNAVPKSKSTPATLLNNSILKVDTLKSELGSPELQRLVNQAFAKLLDEKSINPTTVKAQLEAQLMPINSAPAITNTPTSVAPSSNFSQALDRLIVTLLGAQSIANSQASASAEHKLNALLDLLSPNIKATQPQQLLDAVQKAQSMELLDELAQINKQLQPSSLSSPTNVGNTKQDSESQLLINLLFPTKLQAENQQTQLQVGKYKKPARESMPEKIVWFIRLSFDYGDKGQLHAHAELMDKALECEFVATSEQTMQLASPHLPTLQHKFAAHGLQVSEISLRQEASYQDKFFTEHAIINVRV